MIVGSIDKCDICNIEYDISFDKKECNAKVDNCSIMIDGFTDKCATCSMEYDISSDYK